MKFTDSPVIELKVGTQTLTFEQDNNSMHVGTSVWPCSLVLVKFIERSLLSNPPTPYTHLLTFTNKRAIELGTGCGVAGMGLALLGLNTILTDIAPVMPALKRNLKRNLASTSLSKPNLKIAQLYWNKVPKIESLKPPFDFVIATDVVYLEETVEPLVNTMAALVGSEGVILLGYQLRSPEAHGLFWELCERVFRVEKVPHEDLHPDYAFEETDVYFLRKK